MDSQKLRVLMVGVDHKTKGGMWSVSRGYLQSRLYQEAVFMKYVPVATVGSSLKKVMFFAFGLTKIISLLIAQKWDIVHIHMSERGSVCRKLSILKIAKMFRCKVVLHMHGAEFETWYNELPEGRKQQIGNGMKQADCVLILGEYWRSFVRSLIGEEQKIRVLYNAVHVPAVNRYDTAAKHLLFFGEVGARKGAYDLLKVIARIDDQLDDGCQVLMYGTNPEGDINSKIEERGLQHRVRYMGWADQKQFDQLFSEIAVNVLPSYHEGLPMTILETMAYGIPNITTDIAAIPEAVSKENGVLIQPGDTVGLAKAIVNLLRNQEVREAKSRKAYQTVKDTFSTERHMTEVVKIYKDTIKQEK